MAHKIMHDYARTRRTLAVVNCKKCKTMRKTKMVGNENIWKKISENEHTSPTF